MEIDGFVTPGNAANVFLSEAPAHSAVEASCVRDYGGGPQSTSQGLSNSNIRRQVAQQLAGVPYEGKIELRRQTISSMPCRRGLNLICLLGGRRVVAFRRGETEVQRVAHEARGPRIFHSRTVRCPVTSGSAFPLALRPGCGGRSLVARSCR